MNLSPIAALILSGLAIAGAAVLLGSYLDGQRKERRSTLERQLLEAQGRGDRGEIARLIGELRSL